MRTKIAIGLSTTIILLACSSSDPSTQSTSTASLHGQRTHGHAQLTKELDPLVADSRVPGAAVALIDGDEIRYAHAFGLADPQTEREMTTETSIQLASISKLVLATSLMQLWECGKFGLDDDIDAYLPYQVRNPNAPDVPITFRMLMAHASSVKDNWNLIGFYVDALPPTSNDEFVHSYFAGTNYEPQNNFLDVAPGTTAVYSNVGFALLGELLEVISGESVQKYTQEHIFAPLAMKAKWLVYSPNAPGIDPPAMPYAYDPNSDTLSPIGGLYTFDSWPAGALSTDLISLAHFTAALVNGGKYHSARILKESTVTLMETKQYPELVDTSFLPTQYGLGFEIPLPNTILDEHTYVGKIGSNPGYLHILYIRPDIHVGVILLTNSDIMSYGGQPTNDAVSIILDLFAASSHEKN